MKKYILLLSLIFISRVCIADSSGGISGPGSSSSPDGIGNEIQCRNSDTDSFMALQNSYCDASGDLFLANTSVNIENIGDTNVSYMSFTNKNTLPTPSYNTFDFNIPFTGQPTITLSSDSTHSGNFSFDGNNFNVDKDFNIGYLRVVQSTAKIESQATSNLPITIDPDGTNPVVFPAETGTAGIVLGTNSGSSGARLTYTDSSGTPSINITSVSAGNALLGVKKGIAVYFGNSNPTWIVNDDKGGVRLGRDYAYCFSTSNNNVFDNGCDVGYSRFDSSNTISVDSSTTRDRLGWTVGGNSCFLSSNQTNATTTDQDWNCYVTGTTKISLAASASYSFTCQAFLSDSVAADGAVVDFDGGTATATTFIANVIKADSGSVASEQSTALGTNFSASTFTGAGAFEIKGFIQVNTAGTWMPQFFQAAHTTGTLTLAKGSNCSFNRL